MGKRAVQKKTEGMEEIGDDWKMKVTVGCY